RLREVDRVRLAGDQADEAFVLAQHGLVHRLLLEAFGGVKLERAVHAQHVDGADLRHHVGGNQHHDLVQAFLRADRLRHHLAKPAQHRAWPAERATHEVIPRASFGRGPWGPGASLSGWRRHRRRLPAAATTTGPYSQWPPSTASETGIRPFQSPTKGHNR